MPLQLIPFAGGLQGHIDPRLLPDGALADAVNVELDREGRFVGRARYQAIASTVYGSGTFVGYDLFSVGDRLFALGDRRGNGFPTDVFEYVTGAAAAWVPSDSSPANHRLPRATRLREVGRPPDVSGGVSNMSVSALTGVVLLAYNNDDPDGVDLGYLHAFQPALDRTLFFDELITTSDNVCLKLKALALSDRFLIVGTNLAADRIGVRRFIPASDEASVAVSTSLYSGLGAITVFATCKVEGSDEFVVVANCAGTLITRRFNSTGVLQVPSGGAYANITAAATHLSVYAHASDNHVVVGYEVSGVLRVQTYNLSTGATIDSAVVQLTGVTVGEFHVLRGGGSLAYIVASGADSNAEDSVYLGSFSVGSAAATATSARMMVDAQLTSTVLLHNSELIFACRYGSTVTEPTRATNVLVSGIADASGATSGRLQPLAVKDLEIASSPGIHLPDIALDSSTSRYYWGNAALNPDLDGSPQVTEFALGLAERRQVAIHGNHVYIAGGLPMVFDLRFLCESGFTERPRIISLTGGTSGSLLAGATYKYRLHEEAVDAQGDLHLGPPSEIEEVTLTSSQTKVTAVASTSHSLRRNQPAGFCGLSVRHVLSRTLATADLSAAIIVGVTSINPPSSSLTGLTLKLTAGGSSFTVTFTGSATTQAVVLSEINAVISSEATATAPNGVLVLTSVDTGDGSTLQITNGTANSILGLTEGDAASGETERTVGENFQRAASAYNPTADLPGEFISIVDTRKDESDPIIDTDLIRQQVLYSQGVASGAHHAPPPSEFVWAGRERIVWSGQHKRSRYTATKLIVPGEPAECAAEGFLAFSGMVTGDIEAGCVLGDAFAFFTRTQVWMVAGSGPNRAGQGEFFAAQCVSRRIGIKADGWRSLVEDDEGVWFQGQDSELYHLSRGGEVSWRGKEIREYLLLYPVITGATIRASNQEIAFAVTNTAGSTGGILRFAPDAKAWMFDDVGAVTALADYQGRLAYVQSGTVYLQDAAPGSGTGPNYYVRSNMFQGFQALGYGQVNEIGLLGTFRGNCTVTIKRSANGTSFSETLGTWTLTSSEYDVGERVVLLKAPNPAMQDSFATEIGVSGMTASEGLWLHAFALDTDRSPYPSRQGPAHKL